MDKFKRIGKRWRESVDRTKEYKVVESQYIYEDERPTGFGTGYVTYKEYDVAQRLKQKLLAAHQNASLEKTIPGEEIQTAGGICYRITTQSPIELVKIDPAFARGKIVSELTLLKGVGLKTAARLREQGYHTIDDLRRHSRFGHEAESLLGLIEQCNTTELVGWMARWLPKSHPLVLCSSGFHRCEDFVVLDIETMGLFGRPIILFGLAQVAGSTITVHQYLLREIDEEPAALFAVLGHVTERTVFVTFNGRTFDLPYIRERLAYYGMAADLEHPHFDILHFSRRTFRDFVPDCRLSTLEKHLFGTIRHNDLPSALVPEFYETYLLTKNCGPLVPIVEHNRQDILSLASLFSELNSILTKG